MSDQSHTTDAPANDLIGETGVHIIDQRDPLITEEATSSDTEKVNELISQTSQFGIFADHIEDELKAEFTERFTRVLIDSEYEFGSSNSADRFVKHSIQKIGPFAREWINEIFINNYDKPELISRILRVIAHFSYTEMYPQGVTMAAAALSHRDIEVFECAVRCFENWEQPKNAKILESIIRPEQWLNDYIQNVVSSLKKQSQHDVARA